MAWPTVQWASAVYQGTTASDSLPLINSPYRARGGYAPYVIQVSSILRIYRFSPSGAPANIASASSVPVVNGDIIGILNDSGTIRAYVNGVLKLSIADATYTNGYPGIGEVSTGGGAWDSWKAGVGTTVGSDIKASDEFNRANEDPITGDWYAIYGSYRIVSNQVLPSASPLAGWQTQTTVELAQSPPRGRITTIRRPYALVGRS